MRKALAILLLIALPLPAQTLRESMTVEVIEVPVYVTNAAGKPIRGLTKDAFELRVNGKTQPIEYFDVVDVTAAPAAERRPPRERRLYLFLFDLAYATERDVAYSQRAAETLIANDKNDADLFAVAKVPPRETAQFLTAFLPAGPELRRAIYTLKPSEAHDPLQVAIDPEERRQWVDESELEPTGTGGGRNGLAQLATAERASALRGGPANQSAMRAPSERLTEYQIGGLVELVAKLSGMEGQKHVVFFTEGARATPNTIYLRDLGQAFRASGAFLHAVAPFGGNRETLRLITAETGGSYFWGRSAAQSLQELTTSQQVAYLLAFHRKESTAGGITVQVKGLPRGTSLHYRNGFGPATGKREINQLVLADIITNDIEQNGVQMDGFAKPSKGGVELSVRFPREQIVPLFDNADPSVELYLYVMDPKGSTLKFESKHIVFDEQSRAGEGRLGVKQWFALPPGKYVAKALLTIKGSPAMGFTRGDFTIEAE